MEVSYELNAIRYKEDNYIFRKVLMVYRDNTV